MTTSYPALFLFAGLGGGALGFQRATGRMRGLVGRFRIAGAVDFDAAAARDFEALTGHPCTVSDLATMTPDELRGACPEPPAVLFTSPPCLPADGLVVTSEGLRRVDSLQPGSLVLTHAGRYRRVTKINTRRYHGSMHGLRLNGTVDRQWFTAEHPIWRRRVVRLKGSGLRRELGPAEFVTAAEIRVGDRVGFPVDAEVSGCARSFVNSLGDPSVVERGGANEGTRYAKPLHTAAAPRVRDLAEFSQRSALWFLVGVYLGDGYRRPDRHEVIFCVGASDGALAHRVRDALAELGLRWNEDRYGGKTNVKLRVHARHLSMIMGAFGDGAPHKDIPPQLMGLEQELLEALVAGYRASDGTVEPRRTFRNELQACWKIPSISLPLLRSLQRLLLRTGVYGSIHQTWAGGEQTILGRQVNTKARWELTVRTDPKKRMIHEFKDGAVWVRVRTIETRMTDERVWNLEVDQDDTFCVPMMATHNCKSFSGCLPAATACTPRYQEMADLAVRGLFLTLEAWPDSPPRLILLENVPRIQNRGRHLLDVVVGMLQSYGYACRETVHDCGELGGLGQRRRRFLLVARHTRSVPNYWFEPPRKPLRTVGDVIGQLPVPWPGGDSGGAMHRLPRLSALNWLRLALVPAGGDWRNLPESVEMRPSEDRHRGAYGVERWDDAGHAVVAAANHRNAWSSVADPRLPPREQRQNGGFGVEDWTAPGHAVVAEGSVRNTRAAVADPRVPCGPRNGAYGVAGFEEPSGTVLAAAVHDNGPFSVADPRPTCAVREGSYGVTGWEQTSTTVIAAPSPHNGPWQVADPRLGYVSRSGGYSVQDFDAPANTVLASTGSKTLGGAWATADPRPSHPCRGGSYGVHDDGAPANTVIGEATTFHGQNVRDPRGASRGVLWIDQESGALVGPADVLARFDVVDKRPMADPPIIIAADGTWHRPMTTLELAALQGLPVGREGDWLVLDGPSHRDYRQRVGNCVPPPTAEAIAETAIRALLAADAGVWELGGEGVWVRQEEQEARA